MQLLLVVFFRTAAERRRDFLEGITALLYKSYLKIISSVSPALNRQMPEIVQGFVRIANAGFQSGTTDMETLCAIERCDLLPVILFG